MRGVSIRWPVQPVDQLQPLELFGSHHLNRWLPQGRPGELGVWSSFGPVGMVTSYHLVLKSRSSSNYKNVCGLTLLYSSSRLLLMIHATAHHSETTHSHSFWEIHRFYRMSVSFPILPRVLRGDPITGFWPHLSDHLPPDVAASWRPVRGLSARLLWLLHRFVVGSAMRFSV